MSPARGRKETIRAALFWKSADLLGFRDGPVSVVSSLDIYMHEWASFTTQDFPENAAAHSSDVVRIVVADHQDPRPVEDIILTDESFREVYNEARQQAIQVFKPLAKGDEPYTWVSETTIPP